MTPEQEAKLLAAVLGAAAVLQRLDQNVAAVRQHLEPFLHAFQEAGGIAAVQAKWKQFAPLLEKLKGFLPS